MPTYPALCRFNLTLSVPSRPRPARPPPYAAYLPCTHPALPHLALHIFK